MSNPIQQENNNAVEHMLLGNPKDAVATLLQALDTWKRHLDDSTPADSEAMQVDEVSGQLYSVELGSDVDTGSSAFPFQWYGRPIAVASSNDVNEDAGITVALSHDLHAVVILYNLGIAYQLEATRNMEESDFVLARLHSTAAFESYTLALRALVSCQEKMPRPCNAMSLSERVNFGLLHMAIVNNLLFLYAQSADLAGMNTCLTVLRKILSAVCTGLPESCADDFALFHSNALLFPLPGSLSLSPAA